MSSAAAESPSSKIKIDKTIFFLMVTMLINSLSYGTIIPLFYPYAQRFGLSTFGISMLFAAFSIAQFLATPVIGRLSDKYGRRPLLLGSILGTSISLALFAMAGSVWQLFFARVLDGITGGNVSVAQAVIADRVNGRDRSKALGMIGASFGFGFLLGPAAGGLLSQISLTAPFWFASGLALLASIFGYFFLEESADLRTANKAEEPVMNLQALGKSLSDRVVGSLILTGFISAVGYNVFTLAFQSYTNDVLRMTPLHIGIMFSVVGIVTIFVQAVGIHWLMKLPWSHVKMSAWLLIISALFLLAASVSGSWLVFLLWMVLYSFANSPASSLLTGELSHRTHGKKQGLVLGINQSYASLGQIVGPLLAGAVAHYGAQRSLFWLASAALLLAAFILSRDRARGTAFAPGPNTV